MIKSRLERADAVKRSKSGNAMSQTQLDMSRYSFVSHAPQLLIPNNIIYRVENNDPLLEARKNHFYEQQQQQQRQQQQTKQTKQNEQIGEHFEKSRGEKFQTLREHQHEAVTKLFKNTRDGRHAAGTTQRFSKKGKERK
jgi:hypothetical protein